LSYIHILIERQGTILSPPDLMAEAGEFAPISRPDVRSRGRMTEDGVGGEGHTLPNTHGIEIADDRAIGEVREHLQEVLAELNEAQNNNDQSQVALLERDRNELFRYLASATRLDGLPRIAGDQRENARTAVSNAIHRSRDRIYGSDERFGRHIQDNLQTGRECSYAPNPMVDWITR
jgi:hypothetical protein